MVMCAEFYHHRLLPLSGAAQLIGGYLKQSGGFSRISLPLHFFSVSRTL